jgi:site-specific DNA-adenine methylase
MAHNCVFMTRFRRTIGLAGANDVVCDPPYEPMPGTAGFTAYAAGGFNWDDQVFWQALCRSPQTWREGSHFKLISPEGHRPVPGAWF